MLLFIAVFLSWSRVARRQSLGTIILAAGTRMKFRATLHLRRMSHIGGNAKLSTTREPILSYIRKYRIAEPRAIEGHPKGLSKVVGYLIRGGTMTMPGFVAGACLYRAGLYGGAVVAQEAKESVLPAYGVDECYDDCMATSRDGSLASRRFARFCATACE